MKTYTRAIALFSFHSSSSSFVVSSIREAPLTAALFSSSTINTPNPASSIIQLNHAGASPSPQGVVNTVIQHIQQEQAVGGYAAQALAKERLEETYDNIAQLIHADSSEIALVESATVAWTRIFYAMVEYQEKHRRELQSGNKIILVSEAEYAAQLVAVCKWAKEHPGWTVRSIPSTAAHNGATNGMVNLRALRDILDGKDDEIDPHSIALVCIAHVPTNSGIVNPAEGIGELIDRFNREDRNPTSPKILYLLDACQSIGQLDVNVTNIKCDGLCATGRKYLRGPRGTGFLYASSSATQFLIPSQADHECAPVDQVPAAFSSTSTTTKVEDLVEFSYVDGAKRFQFWESNIASKLGLGEAVRVILNKGIGVIHSEIVKMADLLRSQLRGIEGVSLYHDHQDSQCGIVTFQAEGREPQVVKRQLWDSGYEISVVPATSTPLDSAATQVPDLLRASVSYTTTPEEIKSFCNELKNIIHEERTK